MSFPTSAGRHARVHAVLRALEWPMAILALAVVPALILEDRGTTPLVRSTARAVNWAVWLAFAGEFAVKLAIASEKRALVRKSWFDLLIIVASPPFLVPESSRAHGRCGPCACCVWFGPLRSSASGSAPAGGFSRGSSWRSSHPPPSVRSD
jgi:hypothetical protein